MARPAIPSALVLGDIELVRPLALAGIPCAMVCAPNDSARFSRHASYVGSWAVNDSLNDLLALLESWADRQSLQPVLFYQWDAHLHFVSEFRGQLAERFRFVIDAVDHVERSLDKQRFQEFACDLGLPVPPSETIEPTRGIPSLSIDFPLMLKPRDRIDDRWFAAMGHAKATRVDRADDLANLWPNLSQHNIAVIAQRLIPGPESRIESYHVYVDEAGEVIGEFTGRKVRTYPVSYGATTALVTTNARDVAELGREIVRKTGLRGVAKLDFKRDVDGTLFLLEINPRFNLWHHVGAKAGVNIPELVYRDLCGLPRLPRRTAEANVAWCSPSDALAVEHRPIALLRWARWVSRCQAKGLWSFEDPLPFVAALLQRLGTAARARIATR